MHFGLGSWALEPVMDCSSGFSSGVKHSDSATGAACGSATFKMSVAVHAEMPVASGTVCSAFVPPQRGIEGKGALFAYAWERESSFCGAWSLHCTSGCPVYLQDYS